MFIKELGKRFKKDDIGVFAENKEKYIRFSVTIPIKLTGITNKNGKEIDSCRFMRSSLDKLSGNFDDEQCKNFRSFYQEEDLFKLVRRKAVYRYEYVDIWEKFEEAILPPKKAFYSRLNTDVLSLSDVFETF